MSDFRYALRQLHRAPQFVILAVTCLGLGIGVNTAMFAVLNAVVLRPISGAKTERLVSIRRSSGSTFSYPTYEDHRDRTRLLSALAATLPMESDLDVDGAGEFVTAEVVTPNYGEVFGVRPELGRWFANDSEPMAVISHAVWRRRFNGRPDALGRQIRSESQVYTVVGVAPAEFTGVMAPLRTDLWVPLRTRPALAAKLDDRQQSPLFVLFGQLADGATAAQAAAELDSHSRQISRDGGTPQEVASRFVVDEVRGIQSPAARRTAQLLATLLSGVVAIVLLIAAVNVGHLLMARGASRQREWAIRRALGGTRFTIARQLFAETAVLSTLGGVCGVVVAWWVNGLIERSLPRVAGAFDVQLNLSLDWRVLLFAAGISAATTFVCGLLPAWHSSRANDVMSLRTGVPAAIPRRRTPWGVIAQVAMSLGLLLVTGSFLQAVMRVQNSDPGFAHAGRVYVQAFVPSPPLTRDQVREFHFAAVERLRALPSVRGAALGAFLPLMPARSDCAANADNGTRIPVTTGVVDAGFLDVLDVPLVSGRDFSDADTRNAEPVVIVNRRLADQLWPNEEPVGQPVVIGCRDTRRAVVVGVARNVAVAAVGEPPRAQIFHPFQQQYTGGLVTMIVHAAGMPAAAVGPIRRTLLELGQGGVRIYTVRPLSEHVEQSSDPFQWQASVVTAFAALAFVLAAFGLHGVIAYRIAVRTPEIGVRMALGARRSDIFRDVIAQGMRIVLIGIALGEIVGFGVTRVLGSLQSSVASPGPILYAGAGLVWIAIAFAATYVPAVRASRVSPLLAFRSE